MLLVCGFAPVLSVGERTRVGWFCVICNAIGRVGGDSCRCVRVLARSLVEL
ncbi:hypothetical protein APHNP_1730 [Anaplasma phagocytophilum str. ApNP]|uniref:Uncharacterized protein n=1 Tax=Anaplasma phagocytophilum str. ApNP TaxID=1359153 RepID=A0A0F3NKG1_ANAPH|nr:hypothetical protein APHNP_1730 [Anaplasma phagocytophilum str. ApNP]